jgi:predicted Zn-dependent protease
MTMGTVSAALSVVLSLPLALAVAAPAQPQPRAEWLPANLALLHSARAWEAHDRGDLAQSALRKLVESRPDSPQALMELGELDLRIGDFADSLQVLKQLERRFAPTAARRSFAQEYRIAVRDHVQFAAVSRLIELQRFNEARAALQRLFPDGAPADALSLDYFQLIARLPGGWQPAYDGLRHALQMHPDDPRYQVALARHMLAQSKPEYIVAALNSLLPLVDSEEVRAGEVDALLATGMQALGSERAPEELVRNYLRRHPGDKAVLELREQQARAREERLLLSAQHWGEVLADLQLRLAGELATAPVSEANRQAAIWLERSRASFLARHPRRAAAELRAALAFGHRRFEDEIAVALELDAQALPDEAAELLGTAAMLAPDSAWLFETRVRWLIGHGQAGQALALLEHRPPRGRWTAATRNALLSEALAQRADDRIAAGALAAAALDLESAIMLAPRDPWLRYRLANLDSTMKNFERGREVMNEGARLAGDDPDMRYAQALYLSSLGDYAAALDALEHIDAKHRSAEANTLRDRVRVTLACDTARGLKRAGDLPGARAALEAVEPLAAGDLNRAAELAYAWIAIGFAEHGVELVRPYLSGAGATQATVLLTWAQVLNSAEDSERLAAALEQLRALPALDAGARAELARLQRALDLRVFRALVREHRYPEAVRKLDALLLTDPKDRVLRIARAELFLTMGQPRQARPLFAALASEQPNDIETRLNYVRALIESGDLKLARIELRAIEDKVPADDLELRINLARRQLALGGARAALESIASALASREPRTDVLLLAGRAELKLRNLAKAREYFVRAARSADRDDALAAARELETLDTRLQATVTAGALLRHQPGDPGMSQLDLVTSPSAWVVPLNYDVRLIARADAVTVDAGHAPDTRTTLLGTLPTSSGTLPRYANGRESGVAFGLGAATDTLTADLGTSPLGFERSNVVGGLAWTPQWNSAVFNVGAARRAVTNSELSYAGLRDPITGTVWGAVVQTGPFAGIAWYPEGYSVSSLLQVAQLTGTHVEDNTFAGAHLGADRKLVSQRDFTATAGVTLDYWNYRHNLSNYTLGSGGYYSPQSYLSVAAPLELNGTWRGWSYRTRLAISYNISREDQSPFYPGEGALQSAAAHASLPPGFSAPYFASSRDSAAGYSAYAAAEKRIAHGLVIGGMFSIDRTNYYHPTSIELYVRHAWAGPTRVITPVQPIRPYNP